MRADRVLVAISLAMALAAAVLVLGPLDVGRDNLPYIFLPSLCTLIPLASDRLAALIVAAGLMLMFVFLELFTVGVYFLPAAGAMSTAALVAAPVPMRRRRREMGELVERFRAWAQKRPDVRALALVGSWSRDTARPDSDVDFVVLVNNVDTYVETLDWVVELGAFQLIETRRWGDVTERRLKTDSGLELDVGFTTPAWRGIPGVRPLYDPDGLLSRLLVREDRPSD